MTGNSNRMDITRRDSSGEPVKKVSPTCSKKTISSTVYRSDDRFCSLSSLSRRNSSIRLRCGKMGVVRKDGKKASAVFPESEKEGDVENQFDTERWFDGTECMWLSSDCNFLWFSFDDHRSFIDLSLDEWFSSWLSISGSYDPFMGKGIPFFDGSRINPIEEASLVLDRTSKGVVWQEDLKEVLLNSGRNCLRESSITCSESAGSSYEQSLCEDSSVFDSSWMSLSSDDDSSSQICEFDRMGIWVSLSDKETGLDVFQSDFPSPSYKTKWKFKLGSSDSSVSSLTEQKCDKLSNNLPSENLSEAAELEDFGAHEPLFWPFERKFDWSSEVSREFFCMSPRKNGGNIGTSESFCAPKSIRLTLHQRKKDPKEGNKRRIVYSSRSTVSTVSEWETRDDNKIIKKVSTMPSRLSISSQNSIKKRPLEMKNSTETLVGDYKQFLEEDFVSNTEIPIETLMGLNEFNGHEGVGAEFDGDRFSLDEWLAENPSSS